MKIFERFTDWFLRKSALQRRATSKMECFVIIVNGWKPLTIITKRSVLDVAAVLDPPLRCRHMGRTETIDIIFNKIGKSKLSAVASHI